jgi:hypothetical protein
MKSLIKQFNTYVHKGIMVVAERKAGEVAVKVKYNIAININKVVTLALLGIDESLDLL